MSSNETKLTLPAVKAGNVVPVLVKSNLNSAEHQNFTLIVAKTFENLTKEARSGVLKNALFEGVILNETSFGKPSSSVNVLVVEAKFDNDRRIKPSEGQLLTKLPIDALKASVSEQIRQLNENWTDVQQRSTIKKSSEEAKLTDLMRQRFFIRAYIENKILAEQRAGYGSEEAEGEGWNAISKLSKWVNDAVSNIMPNAIADNPEPSEVNLTDAVSSGLPSVSAPKYNSPEISLPAEPKISPPTLGHNTETIAPTLDMGVHSHVQSKPKVHSDKASGHLPREKPIVQPSAHSPQEQTIAHHKKGHSNMQSVDFPNNISLNIETGMNQLKGRNEQSTIIRFEENLPDKIVRIEGYEKKSIYMAKGPNDERAQTQIEILDGRVTHYDNLPKPPFKPVVAIDDLPKAEQTKVLKDYHSVLEMTKDKELIHTMDRISHESESLGKPTLLEDQVKILSAHIQREHKNAQLNTMFENVRGNVEEVLSNDHSQDLPLDSKCDLGKQR